ncbi:MAG: hypothetical protein ACRYG2_15955 [Janthinobacterium lividum]
MTGRPDAARPPTAATNETVKVKHDGEVGTADISTSSEADGVASVALRAPRDLSAEARSELVDRVMEHPAVQSSDTVHVVVPIGDSASITRLQEHTTNVNARAAGASSIIEAEVVRPAPDA